MSVKEVSVLPRIRFIIPYFGEWPFWMPFFIRSCRHNPTIDWLFYTDCGQPDDTPANMEFRDWTYEGYCRFVSKRLSIDFYPPNPYKLCDLKPALGYVHSDDLEGYDFWAFGDIDVIYGDLRSYFTNERLANKDLLSTHARRVSGHLCLMRSTPEMLSAFKDIPNWQSRLSNPEHHALDEGAFSRLFMGHKNWPDWLRHLAERFSRRCRRSEFVEAHSTYTLLADGGRKIPDSWQWSNGELINSDFEGRTFPYLHFLVWKSKAWSGKAADELIGHDQLSKEGCWRISEKGFQRC